MKIDNERWNEDEVSLKVSNLMPRVAPIPAQWCCFFLGDTAISATGSTDRTGDCGMNSTGPEWKRSFSEALEELLPQCLFAVRERDEKNAQCVNEVGKLNVCMKKTVCLCEGLDLYFPSGEICQDNVSEDFR